MPPPFLPLNQGSKPSCTPWLFLPINCHTSALLSLSICGCLVLCLFYFLFNIVLFYFHFIYWMHHVQHFGKCKLLWMCFINTFYLLTYPTVGVRTRVERCDTCKGSDKNSLFWRAVDFDDGVREVGLLSIKLRCVWMCGTPEQPFALMSMSEWELSSV